MALVKAAAASTPRAARLRALWLLLVLCCGQAGLVAVHARDVPADFAALCSAGADARVSRLPVADPADAAGPDAPAWQHAAQHCPWCHQCNGAPPRMPLAAAAPTAQVLAVVVVPDAHGAKSPLALRPPVRGPPGPGRDTATLS